MPAEAIHIVVAPGQIAVTPPVMLQVGLGFTVNVREQEIVHPFKVTVTV